MQLLLKSCPAEELTETAIRACVVCVPAVKGVGSLKEP